MASQSIIKENPMLQISELMSKIYISELDVGSDYWVYVTHINDPSDFYVRPTLYRNYMNCVEACENPLKHDDLREGAIVIYKSDILKQNVRGKVTSYTQENGNVICNVFALDNGCFERVPMEKLKKPSNYVGFIPPLAIHCELAYCQPLSINAGKWPEASIDAMKFYVGNERAKIIIIGKTHQKLTVELYNTSPDDIGTLLALTGYSSFGYTSNAVSRFSVPAQPKSYYTFKKLNVGDILRVRVLCGDSLKNFYVAEPNNYIQYMQEIKNFSELHKHLKSLEPEDMEVGKPIAAYRMQHSRYERALIKEITKPGEKANVQLVDCGLILEVDVMKMKPITKESYLSQPVTAIYCMANEGQMWDNGLHKFLYPGYEFFITIQEVGDKFDKPNVVSLSAIKNAEYTQYNYYK